MNSKYIKSTLLRWGSNLVSPLWFVIVLDWVLYFLPLSKRIDFAISWHNIHVHRVWIVLTAMFMHVDFIHVESNTFILFIMLFVINSLPVDFWFSLKCFFWSSILGSLLVAIMISFVGPGAKSPIVMGSSIGISGLIGFCILSCGIMMYHHLSFTVRKRFGYKMVFYHYGSKLFLSLLMLLLLFGTVNSLSIAMHVFGAFIGMCMSIYYYQIHYHLVFNSVYKR